MASFVTRAALALSIVVETKAIEKTGEKIGKIVSDKISQFLESLKQVDPDLVTAIEQAAEESWDYGQAILQMEEAAAANFFVVLTMEELAMAVEENPHPQLKLIGLLHLLESTSDDDIRRLAAKSLGEIGMGNEKAINALLVQLFEPNCDSTFKQVIESLDKILVED